jgi:hypothetical protein
MLCPLSLTIVGLNEEDHDYHVIRVSFWLQGTSVSIPIYGLLS